MTWSDRHEGIGLSVSTEIGRGLLIYDGDCGFCTRTAAWIRRRLPAGYEVQASQRLADLERLGLTRAQVHDAAYWIDPDGTRHPAHLAIARSLEAAGGVLRLAGRVMTVWPIERLAGWVYRVIARNRHRLPGSTDHCKT